MIMPLDPRLQYVPGYRVLHLQLVKERGLASSFACVRCGEQAEHWAYDHSDPDEVIGFGGGGGSCTYSTDLTCYQPMCSRCHHAFDAEHQAATHCGKGHEFTPENTYRRPSDGHRACRACIREDHRKWSAKRREKKRAEGLRRDDKA
jgi:ribosomal protein S27AE